MPALEAVLKTPAETAASIRRDVVWALCRMDGSAARAVARPALSTRMRAFALAAAHTAGLWRDVDAHGDLMKLLVIRSLPERRVAAEALGRIGRREAVPGLLAAMRSATDRFLEHSLIYALIRINDRSSTMPALEDVDPRVRRAGLIALDQMRNGGLSKVQVAALLASSDTALQRAAFEVVCRRPAWSSLVRGVLTSWLSGPLSTAQERLLADALPTIGGEPGVVEVVARALVNPATSDRHARALGPSGQRLPAGFPARAMARGSQWPAGERESGDGRRGNRHDPGAGFDPVRWGARQAEPEPRPCSRPAHRRAREPGGANRRARSGWV